MSREYRFAGEASGLRPHGGVRRQGAGGDQRLGQLGCLEQRAHLAPAVLEQAALVGERDRVVEVGAGTKMITEFIVGHAETGSGAWRSRTRAWGSRAA